MHTIDLEIEKLVGYSPVGSDEKRIKKVGSAKLGIKRATPEELAASDDRMNDAAS